MNAIISWFTRNGVAANLLMASIIMAGIFTLAYRVPLEVFPDFAMDRITVNMPYRGATPAEVEEGVVIRIEEAIQDIEGIKEIVSSSSEGVGSVMIEVDSGYDPRELLDDIKNRIDAISYEETLPNGVKYIASYNENGSMQNSDIFVVPESHYFFLISYNYSRYCALFLFFPQAVYYQ